MVRPRIKRDPPSASPSSSGVEVCGAVEPGAPCQQKVKRAKTNSVCLRVIGTRRAQSRLDGLSERLSLRHQPRFKLGGKNGRDDGILEGCFYGVCLSLSRVLTVQPPLQNTMFRARLKMLSSDSESVADCGDGQDDVPQGEFKQEQEEDEEPRGMEPTWRPGLVKAAADKKEATADRPWVPTRVTEATRRRTRRGLAETCRAGQADLKLKVMPLDKERDGMHLAREEPFREVIDMGHYSHAWKAQGLHWSAPWSIWLTE